MPADMSCMSGAVGGTAQQATATAVASALVQGGQPAQAVSIAIAIAIAEYGCALSALLSSLRLAHLENCASNFLLHAWVSWLQVPWREAHHRGCHSRGDLCRRHSSRTGEGNSTLQPHAVEQLLAAVALAQATHHLWLHTAGLVPLKALHWLRFPALRSSSTAQATASVPAVLQCAVGDPNQATATAKAQASALGVPITPQPPLPPAPPASPPPPGTPPLPPIGAIPA